MDDLTSKAELGLPYAPKQVLRRAAMNIPWRMFVGRQVEFNRSLINALAELEARVTERIVAARAQVYDSEGTIRRDLVALQLKVERLEAELRSVRSSGDSAQAER